MVIGTAATAAAIGLAHTDGLRPDPGTARDWMHHELSRPEYHRGLWERFMDWLSRQVNGQHTVHTPRSASLFSTLLIVGLLTAIAVFIVVRLRRHEGRAGRDRTDSSVVGAVDSAEAHRARAVAALADGDYAAAVVEGLRAIARQLVDRDVIPDDPGTTAHELAVAAGPAFPGQADALLTASGTFDRVQYGGLDAARADAEHVVELDRVLDRTKPVRGASQPTSLVPK